MSDAIFEIKKEHYYHGMWRAIMPGGDFIALLWREGTTWRCRWRFRYFKDTQVWDSNDTKRVYGWHAEDRPGIQEQFFRAMNTTLNAISSEKGLSDITYFPCGGDGDAMAALLTQGIEGIHYKKLNQAQHEEYLRTGILPL